MMGHFGKTRERHPVWKGGRRIDRDGYVRVYAPDHFAPRRGGYILEHRLVMERLLDRPLGRDECVHHKDHDRQNNTPANLELIGRSGHSKYHRGIDAARFNRDSKGRYVGLPR